MTADAQTIGTTIDRYIEAFSADRAGWVALFAPDATLEDPVGTPLKVGHEAIGAFWDETQAMADSVRLERTGPVRVAAGEAAFPMRAITVLAGQPFGLDIIDVMAFDDEGRITAMRAFWDPSTMAPVAT